MNQAQLVDATVALLRPCPDSVSLRKELLTAIKQTLATPLKVCSRPASRWNAGREPAGSRWPTLQAST